MKLRESQASDIEQTRKAVRAAIVLLPLLGTINALYLIPALETPWKFALWSYVTHFLTTFQGFFIALLYCFLNGEVSSKHPKIQKCIWQHKVIENLSVETYCYRKISYGKLLL